MFKRGNNRHPHASKGLIAKKELRLKRMGYYLMAGWTLVLILALTFNWKDIEKHIKAEALIALRMTIESDLTFRTWATEHGGVYVPITDKYQPNPYLNHIKDRDVSTTSGQEITLLNPAYIMRQVYQIRSDQLGVYNRLTSLDPINPVNNPDYWEEKSLKELANNKDLDEVSAIVDLNNESSIRLMKPFYIEKGCLKCHGHQNYQVGDVGGGVSASTSLAPYTAVMQSQQHSLLVGYSFIWLVGMGLIGWFMRRLKITAAGLKYLSYHDQLTGLRNRNYLENELQRFNKSEAYPVSIIMADVNGLKLINDFLGHTVGDKLLVYCAQVLKQSLGNSDILARVGGDEFVAILPRTDSKKGQAITEEMQANILIHNQEFPSIPLSVSLGIATAEEYTEDLMGTYKVADDLMYKEKLANHSATKDNMVRLLASSLRNKNHITRDQKRLEEICFQMGIKAKLTPQELTKLILLSQMQDLGKVAIDGEIISKREEDLTAKERMTLKEHTEKGYRLALSSPGLLEIADLILKHHEKWDGSGYPLSLKGKEIPIECRILLIADTFVSLTPSHPDRDALNSSAAIQEIKDGSASAYDPYLVDIFLETIKTVPIGQGDSRL